MVFSYKLVINQENGLVVSPVIGHRRLLCSKEGAESYAGEGICTPTATGGERESDFSALTKQSGKAPPGKTSMQQNSIYQAHFRPGGGERSIEKSGSGIRKLHPGILVSNSSLRRPNIPLRKT